MSRPAGEEIRARRQSLLWLLRSLYVGRVGLCYLAMIQGPHAAPDLIFITLSSTLFLDLFFFLAVFFFYFPRGRRMVRLESLARPVFLISLVGYALIYLPRPAQALGWSRGSTPTLLLLLEFGLLPTLSLLLVKAIEQPR